MFKIHTRLGVSSIHGIGLFADQDVAVGQVVWVPSRVSVMRLTHAGFWALTDGERGCITAQESYWVDRFGNFVLLLDNGRFINHASAATVVPASGSSSSPGSGSVNVAVAPHSALLYRIVATRFIFAGEELLRDYRLMLPRELWRGYCGG